MILADITIDGAPRKVILHAPKNGFFFVIDRTNGKFISAKNFVDVNWATGYDANGRPIEVPAARGAEAYDSIPGPYGAHNWHPMSFNPQTGLVYLPAQSVPVNLTPEKNFKHNAQEPGKFASAAGWNIGFMLNATPPKNKPFGRLIAWDPVKQKEAWRAEYVAPWNGGTLTTAGNLVFQGTADGRFIAYNATTGEKLWESPTGTGVVAAASTYMIDGKQYVSIAVGWGGVFGIAVRATELSEPGHGLHLRGRRQGAAAGLREVPDRGPARGREIRSEGRARRHRALCRRLRAVSWRARRRQGRQRPKPRLCRQGDRSTT